MYVTKDDLIGLGVDTTTSSTLIEALISYTGSLINNYIGYSLVLGTYTLQIKHCCIQPGNDIYLPVRYMSALTKLNGVTYTGVLGTDYQIYNPNSRVLNFFRYPSQYFTSQPPNWWLANKVEIEITAGWDQGAIDNGVYPNPYPADLKYAQALMIKAELSKDSSGRWVTDYTLGPRKVTFSDADSIGGMMSPTVKQILDNYKNVYIPCC